MKRTSLVAVALVAMGALVLSGFHSVWGGGHPWRISRFVNAHVDDVLDDLKANDGQRKQVHGITDGLLKNFESLRAGHEGARSQLIEQWKAPRPDAKQVHAVVDARLDALKTFAHQAADAAIALHDVLTPEQRAQVSERAQAFHH